MHGTPKNEHSLIPTLLLPTIPLEFAKSLRKSIHSTQGLILVTGLEIGNKRPNQAYSQDNPVVWAKKTTHAKIRFAIHEGESTISVKQEFLSSEEFKVGMQIRIEGRIARIKAINLFGGKLVKTAYAIEISRITCVYEENKRR